MNHNDDAYAAMLLTMALSPNREEYARPYGTAEFQRLMEAVRTAGLSGPGRLLGVDISALMSWLGLTEEEGYRVFTLMNRTVPLSYALEGYMRDGVEVVTLYDEDYPPRLRRKLGDSAPVFFYRAGPAELLNKPLIAILGISGVKTTPEARDAVGWLAEQAKAMGYGLVTGGELGISRVAAGAADALGLPLLDVLAGGMEEHIHTEGVKARVDAGRSAVMSLQHPKAMFTVSHATARNRALLALADAAFVFNTDGRRGEAEALQGGLCEYLYAWRGHASTSGLIARGAVPFGDVHRLDMAALVQSWRSARSEQLNFFDMM